MPAFGRFGPGMLGVIVVVMIMVVSRMGMRMIRRDFSGFTLVIMAMVHEGKMEWVGERLQREAEAYKGSQEHPGCFLSLLVNHLVDPSITAMKSLQ
tara:strand:+ start:731 stop:1018 length:288 start_codon:yes stop_codon:yes gene_type:complete